MSKPENKDVKTLKEKLSPLQYEVTQEDGTEPPFKNEYWDNKKEGIYVDVVSGEPLFASQHKYDSGTGWPSFFQPLEPRNIVEKEDKKLFSTRTEVRSKGADSHLGHVFDDGPAPTGKRYCLNSAALTFIPKEDLAKKGYGQYLPLFDADHTKKAIEEQVAYFAGGCFWCVESDFLKVKGVKNVVSGYMGGDEKSPSYEQVSAGETGHAESVRVTFDSSVVSFDDLLKVFWLSIDPTAKDRQFCDVGKQYRSAIFYTDHAQKQAIEKSLLWLKQQFPSIIPVTEIIAAKEFYDAEEYHQRYAEKNPVRYKFYRVSCGRDTSLKELYGKNREEILKKFLRK